MNIKTISRICACASSFALAAGLASAAQAEGGAAASGLRVVHDPGVVVTDGISLTLPPPEGALDNTVNVTGVGEMVIDSGGGFVGLCTGTLINPRAVIFAAHCVNDEPAEDYGAATGGTPISFGFQANNLPALRRWLGLDGGNLHQTDTEAYLYNVEQVWYDERSLELGAGLNFLQADVAIATLDTPAKDVPTWALLLSPLEEQTHAVVNGYGGRGFGSGGDTLGIDFRRRIAENALSVLGSLDDVDLWLFGDASGLAQNLYLLDFDSPGGVDDPDYGYLGSDTGYDFDIFDGPALPREGITAGGDSGGPLIIDQAFEKPVVAGVLSGGSRYFTDQAFSSYGSTSFYQPLFLFWQTIVENNPYAYVSAKAGDANWNSKAHWIQDMDPAYQTIVGGELVNATPGFTEPGVSGETPQFGEVCFIDDCYDLSQESVALPTGAPNSIYVPGGPGTTNFVPDNVVADPSRGIKARYYEVTLSAGGITTLTDAKTIDKLNLNGPSILEVRRNGDLTVNSDYTQLAGILQLDGKISTGEAFIGGYGVLTGSGLFDPTYLTSYRGIFVPGTIDLTGTLTIQGDVILTSATTSVFNVERRKSDVIAVTSDADNPGIISLGGTAVFTPSKNNGPTYGASYTIVTAEGGVERTFKEVNSVGLGVLYPVLTYNPNSVVATFEAGSFSSYLGKAGVTDTYALAFGKAFDGLRATSYADLANVFGAIDVMDTAQLAGTFRNNAAAMAGDLAVSDERQDAFMRGLVNDRLGVMGRPGSGGTLRLIGDASAGAAIAGGSGLARSSASQMSLVSSYQGRDWAGAKLPENVSGFISVGYRRGNEASTSGAADEQSGTWHMAMGVEVALDDANALGTAFGQSRGTRQIGGSLARMTTSHASFYGSHQLGGGAYLGGQVNMAQSRLDAASSAPISGAGFAVDSSAFSYAGGVELGYNHRLGGGLMLTPRTRVEYSSYAISGFQDRQSQLAMAVDGIDRRGLDWRTGLHLAGSASLGRGSDWSIQPEVQVDYVRRLTGNDTRLNLRFLDAQALGVAIPVALHDGSYGEVRGGVSLTDGRLTFGAAIETQLGQDTYRDNRGVVSVGYAF